MSTRNPTLSIGMPVHNGLPFLPEALESLLGQTYDDFELIISDNASDDGTAEVCGEFARRDARIRLLRNSENLGAAENYNRVVREARGRYFKWAAADDNCLPPYLERCVNVLASRDDVVLCYPKTQLIDKCGLRIAEYEDNMHIDHPSVSRRLRHVFRTVGKANCVFGVIRTDALCRTNLIGPYRASDYVLLAELSMLGKFHEVPGRLFLRRIHEDQSAVGKTDREIAEWFRPYHAGGGTFPMWRLFGEHIRAIHRSSQPLVKRVACYPQLVHLLRRHRSSLFREIGCARLLTQGIFRWSAAGNEPVNVR